MGQLLRAGLIDGEALTANGQTVAANIGEADTQDLDVIRTLAAPLRPAAGLTVLRGHLFDNAVMKLRVISPAFRERSLSNERSEESRVGNECGRTFRSCESPVQQ